MPSRVSRLSALSDDSQWRVVANFKEYVASRLKPGMRAWIWLDSHPWRLFAARVVSIGRGISREQDEGRLLPFVAPTTDWIRLARRMPVTFVLEPQAGCAAVYGLQTPAFCFFPEDSRMRPTNYGFRLTEALESRNKKISFSAVPRDWHFARRWQASCPSSLRWVPCHLDNPYWAGITAISITLPDIHHHSDRWSGSISFCITSGEQ